ncbi:unnamed protein product, partial [Nesidiocoris tenuis]
MGTFPSDVAKTLAIGRPKLAGGAERTRVVFISCSARLWISSYHPAALKIQISFLTKKKEKCRCVVERCCASRSATPWSTHRMQPEYIEQRGATWLN